jgi:hypothetical protein
MRDGLAKARVSIVEPTGEDVDVFRERKPDLVATLDAKLDQMPSPAAGSTRHDVRDRFVKAFLTKEQILKGLEEWPDTREPSSGPGCSHKSSSRSKAT